MFSFVGIVLVLKNSLPSNLSATTIAIAIAIAIAIGVGISIGIAIVQL